MPTTKEPLHREIARAREIVSAMLKSLEKAVSEGGELETGLWGEKETPLSALVTLSGIIAKLAPLEKELEGGRQDEARLTDADKEIIERFLARHARGKK